jgi:hypothetical protein
MNTTNSAPTRAPVLVALLHELLRRETFTTYADLVEALKTRAAQLHIPYDGAAIQDAVRQVEHVVGDLLVAAPAPVAPPVEDIQPLTREEAADFFRRLKVACARQQAPVLRDVPTMQRVRPLTDDEQRQRRHRDDQLKAYRIVQQQILDSAQRAAELEAIVEEQEHKS